MKILITGGHLTPALSFIDFVKDKHPQDKLIFVGREFSQDVLKQKAVERYEVEKRKVPFIAFQAIRLGSQFLRQPIKQLRQLRESFRVAKKILEKQQPTVVMSFGGYLAVPFAVVAKRLSIPIVTHEQTISSGFANKFIGLIADKVAVSFSESQTYFLASKTVLTGNPLRAGVFRSRHSKPSWLPSKLSKPLILIMGGNQGSQKINETIVEALPKLTQHWLVVHQCGKPTAAQPYKEILTRYKKRLPKDQQQRYFIKEWIDENDLFWLYRHAFCAISRSGANVVQELAVAQLPAILIPLPNSRGNEQHQNASWLSAAGGAILLEQSALRTSTIMKSLATIKTLEKNMRKNMTNIRLPKDAAAKLYELVTKVALSK